MASLNLLVERFVVHPLPVRDDVEAQRLHLLDLVLAGDTMSAMSVVVRTSEPLLQLPQAVWVGLRPVRREARHLVLNADTLRLPVLPHLVVHPQGGGLVDGDDHRLALEPSPEEVLDDVLGDRLQPVVAGEQVILPSEFPFKALLLVLIEVGGFDERRRHRR